METKYKKTMKTIIASFLVTLIVFAVQAQKVGKTTSFYDLKAETIDGKPFDFSSLKGKKVLIVNTASKCGFTPQYKELENLYKTYGGEKFVIIGFPANNFKNQEPGANEEIKEFCQLNYGVTFPMMSKISVKGDDMNPVYQWLTKKERNGKIDSEVSWNFQKYMIDEKGNLVDYAAPKESPTSDKIVNWIKG
jgi:glutathione peroxidase